MSDHYLPFVLHIHFIFKHVLSFVGPKTVPFWLLLIHEWDELYLDPSVVCRKYSGEWAGPYAG